MSSGTDSPIVVRGIARTIEYAVCLDGSMPAKDFVEALDDSDQRKLDTLFRRLADTGKIFNREQFKLVEGEIFEFKRYQVRVGCFQIGSRWLLTHGFVKKQDRWPKAELTRANRIREEHLERERKQAR
ncbi:MAG: hypothetical protein GX547_16125 [Phycisphaerae bacterium]|nr:hypothetical protein [Phycisphaerae bacterium]